MIDCLQRLFQNIASLWDISYELMATLLHCYFLLFSFLLKGLREKAIEINCVRYTCVYDDICIYSTVRLHAVWCKGERAGHPVVREIQTGRYSRIRCEYKTLRGESRLSEVYFRCLLPTRFPSRKRFLGLWE